MAAFGFEPTEAIAYLRAADPALTPIIDAAGPFAMELKTARSVFAALAEAIVYQQLSNKAAATIFGRLCGHFPRGAAGLTSERLLALSDARIRGAGISRPKLSRCGRPRPSRRVLPLPRRARRRRDASG
jgi:3-methyladenine DNA glycosylase/8-oxoguanine DNA glycosylase